MEYGKAIRLNPRCAEAYVNIAYSFQVQRKYKKAYEMFSAVLAFDRKNVAALEGRAIILLTVNHMLGALADMTKALWYDKENVELLVNRGVIYQALHDNARAAADYKVSISSLKIAHSSILHYSVRLQSIGVMPLLILILETYTWLKQTMKKRSEISKMYVLRHCSFVQTPYMADVEPSA
jgi:tetratricopeptide (TPR) repeat protein